MSRSIDDIPLHSKDENTASSAFKILKKQWKFVKILESNI